MMKDTFNVSITHLGGVKFQYFLINERSHRAPCGMNSLFCYSLFFTQCVHGVVNVFPFFSVITRDFLPRGSGIVTRRPLILQLVNSNAGESPHFSAQLYAHPSLSSYAVFLMCCQSSLWFHLCNIFTMSLAFLCVSFVCRICRVLTLQRKEVCGLRRSTGRNWGRDWQDNRLQQRHLSHPN